MRGHVFERFGRLFGASASGCTVRDALVLVATDRRGCAARSSLDESGEAAMGIDYINVALNASFIPHDEAVYGVLRCVGDECGEALGLDRVSCRDNSRELWFSTTKTTRCDRTDEHDDAAKTATPLRAAQHPRPHVCTDGP